MLSYSIHFNIAVLLLRLFNLHVLLLQEAGEAAGEHIRLALCTLNFVKFPESLQLLKELQTSFNEGNPDGIKPDLLLNEQGDLLPYDYSFEFPLDRLTMGKQLGAGAFGIVMKATARGIIAIDEDTLVAVKMVKSKANHEVWSGVTSGAYMH